MALIKCPECGHDVSDKASMCPNCGYPISEDISISSDRENQTTSENNLDAEEAMDVSSDRFEVETSREEDCKNATAKKKKYLIMVAAVAVVVVLVLFLGLRSSISNNDTGNVDYFGRYAWGTTLGDIQKAEPTAEMNSLGTGLVVEYSHYGDLEDVEISITYGSGAGADEDSKLETEYIQIANHSDVSHSEFMEILIEDISEVYGTASSGVIGYEWNDDPSVYAVLVIRDRSAGEYIFTASVSD